MMGNHTATLRRLQTTNATSSQQQQQQQRPIIHKLRSVLDHSEQMNTMIKMTTLQQQQQQDSSL
ncbi:hypothetical protein DERP_008010 [Dermatophagoides pteronyssinus]|uniref:Uncharacterized protein n=1 Tax=Dermatophagoides pteronyssinus TaxID=6956 RepID=A0ABQ8ITK3_DERPT|nr:hypothetical protein DERP_008010 [Dermatophagoides pteronyssinus]